MQGDGTLKFFSGEQGVETVQGTGEDDTLCGNCPSLQNHVIDMKSETQEMRDVVEEIESDELSSVVQGEREAPEQEV